MSASTPEGHVALRSYTVDGIEVPVTFNPDAATFHASVGDADFQTSDRTSIERQIKEAVRAIRIEVPFVTSDGTRGVARGFHAGNNTVLVTYEDGTKDALSEHSLVFPPDAITSGEMTELGLLAQQIARSRERIAEIHSKTVKVRPYFAERLGRDLFDWRKREEGS